MLRCVKGKTPTPFGAVSVAMDLDAGVLERECTKGNGGQDRAAAARGGG